MIKESDTKFEEAVFIFSDNVKVWTGDSTVNNL